MIQIIFRSICVTCFVSQLAFAAENADQTQTSPPDQSKSAPQPAKKDTLKPLKKVDKPKEAPKKPAEKPLEKSLATRDRSDYTGNVRVSPLGLFIGYINVDLDFKVSDNWSLGPTVSYWSFNLDSGGITGISTVAYDLGVRANWYPDGVYESGWYVSPMLRYVYAKATAGSVSASIGVIDVTALGGYHWFWNPFNLSLGLGLGTFFGPSKVHVDNGTTSTDVTFAPSGTIGLAADVMIGLNF